MKKLGIFLVLIASAFSLFSCKNTTKTLTNIKFSRNEEFDNMYIEVNYDTLFKTYALGDSLNFKFSNGYEVKDVPLFDGYYGGKGDSMFVAYPTYTYPVLLKQYEQNIIDAGNLKENDVVTISLNKEGKYKEMQDAFSLKYSNDRNEYESDEVFANYRNIKVGKIKEGKLYRSSSSCDNSINRATYVNSLMEKDKIDFVFDLSNDSKQLENYSTLVTTGEYWKTLYSNNHVFDIKVTANYYSDSYYPKIKKMCDEMIDNDGKYLFHCFEGKDRTGFVAILLESLCGASFSEIENDYFVTYKNLYNFTYQSNPRAYEIYRSVRFYAMTNFIVGSKVDENATEESLYNGAFNYLKKCGLSSERISLLVSRLTK